MTDVQNIFLIFSGIFWTTSLQSYSRYCPFDTSIIDIKNIRRFIVSFVIINIIPIFYTFIIFNHIRGCCIDFNNFFGIVSFNFAHFGTVRIYHGVIFSKQTRDIFYTPDKLNCIIDKLNTGNIDSAWAHIVPGLFYWIIFIILGFMLVT